LLLEVNVINCVWIIALVVAVLPYLELKNRYSERQNQVNTLFYPYLKIEKLVGLILYQYPINKDKLLKLEIYVTCT